MPTISEINVRIGAKIDDMVKNLGKAERSLQRSGRKLKRLGNDLTNTVSLPLLGIGVAGVKMSGDLSSAFSKVENLVGVTGKTLDKFKVGIKSLSNEVGKSQKELAEALFTITSAGLKGEEALTLLESSAKASAIGMGETRDIAKAATAIIQAYGKENISSAEAVNLLTKTVREGNLAAEELAPSIGKVLPVAAQLGVSFQEVGANIATFTRLGVSASESVTALNAFLSNLIKPGKEATKVLMQYGLTAQGVRDAISRNGLSATLKDLLKRFDGNTESVAKLFGSVRGLQAVLGTAGAQGEEYTRILNSMNDGLDVVEKGFTNVSESANQKFNKALVRLQNIAIDIGAVVIPIFVEVAEVVSDWAERFSKLDASTQRTIIKIGAFVASIGPAIKVLGVLKITLASVRAAQATMLIQFKNLSGGILVLASKWKALNNVMRLSIIGAVTGAVIAAAAAFRHFSKAVDNTTMAQKALQSITNTAQQSIVEERLKVEKLVGVLRNENATRQQKQNALRQLQSISPKYFGGLDTEKIKIDNVVSSMDMYIANLLQIAKVQAAKEKIIELNKALFDQQKITEAAENVHTGFFSTIKRLGATEAQRIEGANKRVDDYKAGIQEQIDALSKFVAAEEIANNKRSSRKPITPTTPSTPAADGGGGGIASLPNLAKASIPAINQLSQASSFLKINLDNIGLSQESVTASMMKYAEMIPTGTVMAFTNVIDQMNQSLKNQMQLVGNVADAMQDYAKQGGKSLKELGKSALKAAADFVRAKMMEAVSAFLAKSFAALGPAALLVAGAGSAIVGTLFNKAISGLSIPALAEGGLATGPTLAMVGDNPNAGADPEVIAPLSKLKGMLGGMGGNVNVTGQFMVRGDDLLLVLDNATRNRIRTRGF